MDSTIAWLVNDNINMDSTIAWLVNTCVVNCNSIIIIIIIILCSIFDDLFILVSCEGHLFL
jgi:hypothetical protein